MQPNNGDLKNQRLVVVSNRLPFELELSNGNLSLHQGSGGLITALAPVLKNRGGKWIGWPGHVDVEEAKLKSFIENSINDAGFSYCPVFLTEEDVKLYYQGFANEIIWPLFHDLLGQCHFDPIYWDRYQIVNAKFANTVIQNTTSSDFIWVHDYHLLLLADELKKQKVTSKIGFFLHIPFPSIDIFMKLPWRTQILNALLKYDLVGFQTQRDKRNFIQCVRALSSDTQVLNHKNFHTCKFENREVKVGAFPISIDFNEFMKKATDEEVSKAAWHLHENFKEQQIILSIDRLDYTKGILERLQAIRIFLKRYPEFHKRMRFIQIVVPSRVNVPKYQILKQEIDRLVGEINSEFTHEEWVPIYYLFKSLSKTELYAYYRTSEIALVTPIKDGMNLVAKEYVACNIEQNGTLILSEFAGAASQLYPGAILVNPYDVEGIAEAIYKAFKMDQNERRQRMKTLRRNVRRYDIYWWTKAYLNTAFGVELHELPILANNMALQHV